MIMIQLQTGARDPSRFPEMDRGRIPEDVADEFVRSMMGAFRKVRKWCKSPKSSESGKDCEAIEFDRNDLKSKLLTEIANFNN